MPTSSAILLQGHPKDERQFLKIGNKTVLEKTIENVLDIKWVDTVLGSSLFHVGRCGWDAVKQSQIRRRRRMNRFLNPKRRMKNVGEGNCDTAY